MLTWLSRLGVLLDIVGWLWDQYQAYQKKVAIEGQVAAEQKALSDKAKADAQAHAAAVSKLPDGDLAQRLSKYTRD